jgi:hypothetical protein
MICAVIEALQQQSRRSGNQGTISAFEVRDVSIPEPLVIPTDDIGVEIQLRLNPANQSNNSAGWFRFSFSSCSQGNTFIKHMQGLAQIQYSGSTTEVDGGKELREETLQFQVQLKSWLAKDTQLLTKNEYYEIPKRQGMSYGKKQIIQGPQPKLTIAPLKAKPFKAYQNFTRMAWHPHLRFRFKM